MKRTLTAIAVAALTLAGGVTSAKADTHYRYAGSERFTYPHPTVQFFPDNESFVPDEVELTSSLVAVARQGSGTYSKWRQAPVLRLGPVGRTTTFFVYSSVKFRPVLHKTVTETTYETKTETVRITYAKCRVESRRLVSDRTSYYTGMLSGQITVEYTGTCEGDTPDLSAVTYHGSWRDDVFAIVTYYPGWNRSEALLGDVDVSKVGDIAYDYTAHERTVTHTVPVTHTRVVRYLGPEQRVLSKKRVTVTRSQ